MRAKRILSLLALLICAAPAFAAAPVEKRVIQDKRANFSLDMSYPRTGQRSVDATLEAYARALARDFVDMAKDEKPEPQPWSGELAYDVVRNDAQMIVVAFTWYTYTGGAHPNATSEHFNFLLPEGARIDIAELFTPKGIQRISDISIAKLKRDLAGPDGMSDIDWIKRGAGPNARNFASFSMMPRELVVVFDAYQVAAYAAGPQEVRIPLSQLKDVLRPDPRAPAPSFDCALARSDVEQAICSNRDLARLDRHVAEAYAERLMWAENEARRAAIRQGQRDWLKTRDRTCLVARQPLAACLMGVYQSRLGALNQP
jgi:uncharacterized protein YecT (DUF1311 family)